MYHGIVTFKRMKRLTFRLREGVLLVSSPNGIPLTTIEHLTYKVMPKILKRSAVVPRRDDAFLWFGSWRPYDATFTPSQTSNRRFLQAALLAFATPRIAYWCQQLADTITPPKLRIRSMLSRWGTYSKKTHRITLATTLIHFDPTWIDAVIAHECVHIIHFDHSSRFYATLHRLMPTYEHTHAKLKQGYPHANMD